MKISLEFQLMYVGGKEATETLLRRNMIKPEYVELVKLIIKDLEKDITHPIALKRLTSIKKEADKKLK